MSSIPSDNDPRTTEQILADAGFCQSRRARVIRRGEREPISPFVRRLVYRRDNYQCQQCGDYPWATAESRRSGALHLDHIVPWSAGGSDRTDNLRTLCGPCNEVRSNFVSDKDQPAMPIVRVCLPCLTNYYERPPNAFDVYCGSRSHVCWALPGWHIL